MGWCHPAVPVVFEGCRDASAAVGMGDGESGICTALCGCYFLSAPGEAHEKNHSSALKPNWARLVFGEDAL